MKETIKYLNEREILNFFDVAKKEGNTQHQLIFKLMFHYGLRVQECVKIELEDISEKLNEIRVKRVKQGISRHYSIRPDDAKLLNRWLKVRQSYPNAKDNSYLFITKRSFNGSMTMINVFKAHEKYCKLAGFQKRNTTPMCGDIHVPSTF